MPIADTIRAEIATLEAARAALVLPTDGLEELTRHVMSDPARSDVERILADYRERDARLKTFRQTLIDALGAHDRLLAHGYPSSIDREVEPSIYTELGGEKSAVDAAFSHFRPIDRATSLNVSASTEPA